MPTSNRILWISDRYPPLDGGMAVSSARQVASLRRYGLSVDVMALIAAPDSPELTTHPQDHGQDFILRVAAKPGLAAAQAFQIAKQQHLRRPYTYVVGFGANRPGHLAVTLATWLSCSSLVLVRGNDFDQDWFDPVRGYYVAQALSRATIVGAVSFDLVGRIRALYPRQEVRFIPNGVDPAHGELLPADRQIRDQTRRELAPNGQRVFGLFGDLKEKKGIPLWLGAVRDSGLTDQMSLLIVGRILDPAINSLLDDPSLVPRHLYLSPVSRDKLAGYYAACDFVVLPSWFDGLPNVLLEAMSLGVIPLVSAAGAMAEIISDNCTGFVFPVMDRQAAAETITRALSLKDTEQAAMRARVITWVKENFSVHRELHALTEILDCPSSR